MSTITPTPPTPPVPPTTAVAAEVPWRRLNTRMLIVHPIQELIRFIPGIAALFFAGNTTSGHGELWGLFGAVLTVCLGLVRWFTTTYRVTSDQVQLRRGLLQRRLLTAPLDRVRTVDVTANALHRVLGLARVSVGTGQSDRKEQALRLDALSAAEAEQLAGELLHRRSMTPAPTGGEAVAAPPSPAGTPVRELAGWRPAWIRYGPFTLSGLVTVAVIAGFAWRIISEAAINIGQLPEVRAAQAEAATIGIAAVVVVLALAGIALVALLSTLGYAFAFWGFRLTRQAEGTLQVRRGLVTTRVTTIEERRLRGVEISEPLLLRAVGGARCLAITTGLRVGRGSERGGSMLLPPAPRTEAIRVAAEVLGRPRPIVAALIPHGARAARRRFTRALAVAAILCAGLLLGCWRLGLSEDLWIASLAVFPIAALLAADRAHSLGHVVADGALIVRLGSLIRRRSIVNCEGIIGWNLRQTFFQRRLGLGTLAATTAAGRQRYEALDVPLGEAVRTAEQAVPGLLRPFLVPADRA